MYWIPLYDLLEARGVTPCLVNARHMKNVPGRRTDWPECQWLQFLHAVGLLRPAFRPEAEVCRVRTLMRHRAELVTMASQHVLHMHKALTQMNLQIHHVISDITGTTGLAIVDAILAGQRDPAKLASLRDVRVKASTETIQKSLVGTWQSEHLFTLKQSRDLYRFYQDLCVAKRQFSNVFEHRWMLAICAVGDLSPAFLDVLATAVRLAGPGGLLAIIAESVLVTQQLFDRQSLQETVATLRLGSRQSLRAARAAAGWSVLPPS